ncbi:MAG: mechanosensitive ion channel family protein [Methanosarcinaceae archaeon]
MAIIDLGQKIPYMDITIFQVLTAIIILIIGLISTKVITFAFKKQLRNTKLPDIVVEFLARFLSSLLYVIVILLSVRSVGIEVGSIVVGLSAVIGLILGFGLQDTMTNILSGIWLTALRPINKGDVIATNGETGTVDAVGMMATEILSFDNKFITIPNRLVWGSVIVNYTRMPTRRVDVDVGVSYGTDLDTAISIAMDTMKKHSLVLGDPEFVVVVKELADSSVNLQLRAWSKTADYWIVKGELTKGIFEAFNREGINIPFPQMDVHLKQQ